jgi:hypothetical protein
MIVSGSGTSVVFISCPRSDVISSKGGGSCSSSSGTRLHTK